MAKLVSLTAVAANAAEQRTANGRMRCTMRSLDRQLPFSEQHLPASHLSIGICLPYECQIRP
jgi:hypothetical protein